MRTEEWQFVPEGEKSQPIQVLTYRLMPPDSSDVVSILHLVISAIRGDEYLEENTKGFLQRRKIFESLRLNTHLLRISELPNQQYEAFFTVKTLRELAEFIPEDNEIQQLLRKQNKGI